MHLLDFAGPLGLIGGLDKGLDALVGLGDGAAEVAAADAELDGDQPLPLFAEDGGRAARSNWAFGL